MEKYSTEELRAQGLVVTRILETGTEEERLRLKIAESDSELHPQIRELIRRCRNDFVIHFILNGLPIFNDDVSDIEVAGLAKQAGGSKAIIQAAVKLRGHMREIDEEHRKI